MALLKCTKKLQKEIGLKQAALLEVDEHAVCLGSWHANVINIDRRKCLLFVNDKTLLNFVIPNVLKPQIKNLSKVFRDYLLCVLIEEGVPEHVRKKIIVEYEFLGYGNTNNKSILGSMNDLASHYKYFIESAGGVHSHAVPTIIKKLNRMPMGVLGYKYSIEVFNEVWGNEI